MKGWSSTRNGFSFWRNLQRKPLIKNLQWDRSWSRTWWIHGTYLFLCFNFAFYTYYNVCLIWLPRNNSKKRKLGIWLLFPFFLFKFSVLLVTKVHVTYCSLLLLKESYCEALHRYKEELSKPFDEATTFLSSIELQLSNLCKGTLTRNLDYRSGMGFLFYFFETFLNSESYNFLSGFAPSSHC